MKKTIIILCMLICLVSTNKAMAYNGPVTHTRISRKAIEISDLEEYLRENLGIKTSQKFTDSDNGQTRTGKEWIEYGSAAEDEYDSAGIRPLRHFHNPINNRGLYDPVARPTWYSSIEWGTTRNENIWNWNRAREYYYLALTSPTTEERSNYYAKMFRALGQVMHLIEDASVPHHVRNDQHLESTLPWVDHYEEWVRDNIDPMQFNVGAFDFSGISNFTVNNFWDQELYTGVEYANYMQFPENAGIAEFTNYHFLSEDTLFLDEDDPDAARHYFPHPNIENTDFDPAAFPSMLVEARPGITDRIHVINGYGNEPLAAVGYFAQYVHNLPEWLLPIPREVFIRKYCLNTDNNVVFREYANKLVPKAVSYSSGLLNYFFRGRLEVDIEVFRDEEEDRLHERKFRLIIRPISEYSFAPFSEDNFEIYYDTATGLSYLLRNRRLIADVEYRFEGDAVIAEFPIIPYQDGLVIGFTIVYHGELGEEEIVIGRDIFLCPLDSITGVMNGVVGIGNESIEDQQTRYNALRIQTWEDYFSETALSFADVLEDLHVYRIDYWSPGYDGLFEINHVAIRSYAWARTEIFSTINSAKLIGFKQQVDTPLDEPPLELTAYFYKVPPLADAPLVSDASILWTRMEQPPGELLWSESTEGMVLGVYYPLSIEFDPGILLLNEPLFLEIKSDKEWIDYTPISFPPSPGGTAEGLFAFSEMYFVIDGTLKEMEEQ